MYSLLIAGWCSNSKYPFLGGLRAAAQMISYDVSLGLILLTIVISAGSMNLTQIVLSQVMFGLYYHIFQDFVFFLFQF